MISDIVTLINVNFSVFGVQRCQNSTFFIFGIYSLLYTLGLVQTKLVHSIFLFFPLFFGSKHFCLLGLNSDSRGWSLIMVGLISDNSVVTHKYTQIIYTRLHSVMNYLFLKEKHKNLLVSGWVIGEWGTVGMGGGRAHWALEPGYVTLT